MEVIESEFNQSFIFNILRTLEWQGVLIAASAVGMEGMPAQFDAALLEDPEFLLAMHKLLLAIHIKKGNLMCPESGRRFPIENGIADMK